MDEVDLIRDVAARRSIIGIAAFLGCHKMTAHRAMTRGNRYGVRLKYVVISSSRYTCEQWAREYVAETTRRAALPRRKPGRQRKAGAA